MWSRFQRSSIGRVLDTWSEEIVWPAPLLSPDDCRASVHISRVCVQPRWGGDYAPRVIGLAAQLVLEAAGA